ncbi:MAG: type 4a pilus biogenesis protein PilO [Deltaproteobacteria bacterium]|nr:type 4a pilus biogenesis protein PilO [Deltaproteobacteria bacterium]
MNSDIQKLLSSFRLSISEEQRKEIIAVVLVAAFSLLFYRFVYLGNARAIAQEDLAIANSQRELAAVKEEIQGAHTLKKLVEDSSLSLKRLEARLRDIKERIPSNRNVSGVIAEISGGDAKSGVRVLGIKPLPPETRDGLTRLPFLVTVEGRFASIGDWFERIENMRRIMVIDNILLEPRAENSQALSAQVYVSAYARAGR